MRPVVLGLNNPYSADPKDALGVKPEGSAGNRLWLMVKDAANRAGRDFTEEDYLEGFDRRNLMNAHFYNHDIAVKRRSKVLHELQRKVVVTCGTGVLRALGLRHTGFHLEAQAGVGFIYYVIPHPSGLTREYNSQETRQRVGDLMLRLLDETKRSG